jgi:hypothetical protein
MFIRIDDDYHRALNRFMCVVCPCLDVEHHPTNHLSFSIRSYADIVHLSMESDDEFHSYQISIRTRSSTGILTQLHANADHRSLILSLKHGRLQINYEQAKESVSQVLFYDDHPINDGQSHQISLKRLKTSTSLANQIFLQLDQRTSTAIPMSDRMSSLFFDRLTIGNDIDGKRHNQTFVGCFAHIVYNDQPLIPRTLIDSDRADCAYEYETLCDRRQTCSNRDSSSNELFCGENDCSLVCRSKSIDIHRKNFLVQYLSGMNAGHDEEISFMVFSTTYNATLYSASDGSLQVSLIVHVSMLIVKYVHVFVHRDRLEFLSTFNCTKYWHC